MHTGVCIDTVHEEMIRLFSEKSRFQRWLTIEASLAKAQAALGIIPRDAAERIAARADVELLDLDQYQEMYRQTAHPMVALLRLFQPVVGEAGQYLHMGPPPTTSSTPAPCRP